MVSWFMQMSLLFWLCVLGVSFLFSDQLKIDFIGMKNPKQNPQQSWPTNKWNDSLGILLVSMLSLFLPQNHNRVKFIGKQQKKLHKHYKHFLETLSHFFKGIIVTKKELIKMILSIGNIILIFHTTYFSKNIFKTLKVGSETEKGPKRKKR